MMGEEDRALNKKEAAVIRDMQRNLQRHGILRTNVAKAAMEWFRAKEQLITLGINGVSDVEARERDLLEACRRFKEQG